MLACGDEFRLLKTCFLALLVEPGVIILNRAVGPESAAYVVDTCEYGVIVWSCTFEVVGIQRVVVWTPPPGKPPWSFRHIFDLKDWYVQVTTDLPPGLVKAKNAHGEPRGIMVAVAGNTLVPVLKAAALRGFVGLTVPFMKKLATEVLEIPCPYNTEFDIAKHLVLRVLPNLEDNDLALILGKRKLKFQELAYATVLEGDAVGVAVDCLGSDFKEAAHEMDTYNAHVKAIKAAAVPKAKPKAAPKKKKKLAPKDHLALEAARRYMPPVVGCTLSLETEWHCRWKAQYPRATPPFSFSDGCHFDPADEIGQRRALMNALRWLWNSHAELTGEACPYELDV